MSCRRRSDPMALLFPRGFGSNLGLEFVPSFGWPIKNLESIRLSRAMCDNSARTICSQLVGSFFSILQLFNANPAVTQSASGAWKRRVVTEQRVARAGWRIANRRRDNSEVCSCMRLWIERGSFNVQTHLKDKTEFARTRLLIYYRVSVSERR